MALKTANVTARIEPEIKEQAEAVLDKLGIPIAVLIDTLYRQIIMTGGIPFSLTVPKPSEKPKNPLSPVSDVKAGSAGKKSF